MAAASSLVFQVLLVTGSAIYCLGDTDSGRCKPGWKLFENNCYFFSNNTEFPDRARDVCHSMDSHLVDIRSEQENQFVHDNIGTGDYTSIGLHRRSAAWYFDDDAFQATYLPWGPDEPNNVENNERCAHMRGSIGSGTWNDLSCSANLPYICKIASGLAVPGLCDAASSEWKGFRENCYIFRTESLPWHGAKQQCESIGAKLVEIKDSGENRFVTDNMAGDRAWIGLHYRPESWGWNSEVDQIDFTKWYPGQPQLHAFQPCVVMRFEDDYWMNQRCNVNARRYTCKTSACTP